MALATTLTLLDRLPGLMAQLRHDLEALPSWLALAETWEPLARKQLEENAVLFEKQIVAGDPLAQTLPPYTYQLLLSLSEYHMYLQEITEDTQEYHMTLLETALENGDSEFAQVLMRIA